MVASARKKNSSKKPYGAILSRMEQFLTVLGATEDREERRGPAVAAPTAVSAPAPTVALRVQRAPTSPSSSTRAPRAAPSASATPSGAPSGALSGAPTSTASKHSRCSPRRRCARRARSTLRAALTARGRARAARRVRGRAAAAQQRLSTCSLRRRHRRRHRRSRRCLRAAPRHRACRTSGCASVPRLAGCRSGRARSAAIRTTRARSGSRRWRATPLSTRPLAATRTTRS